MKHAIQRTVVTSTFKRGQLCGLRGGRYGAAVCLAAWLCVCQHARAQAPLPDDFNPGAGGLRPSYVNSLPVQADGEILVGGEFATLGGQPGSCLGRVNADGSLDSSFNPRANAWVNSLVVQADGKILVGGEFTTLCGQTCSGIGRLNADGSLDSSFNPGATTWVLSVAVQADGKILVGGWFTTLGGQPRSAIGRLNADGSLDSSFNPGANDKVASLAVQADGKILVGGWFTTLGGQPRPCIGRLNADGSLDSNFNPGAEPEVFSLAVQADGKILVGGWFTALGGQPRSNIGRLNADGSLDSSFNPGADGNVYSLSLQADGKILVGGDFTTLGGQPRPCIGRLNNTEPATQSLSCDGSTITWLRGGSSPEVWRTAFEFSTNAVEWVSLGAGTRIAEGWQLTNTSLPSTTGTLRARGFVTGGDFNGSGWFVESILLAAPPNIVTPPLSQTAESGSSADFQVDVTNTVPGITYQWYFDGTNALAGATNSPLELANVQPAQAGLYTVVVTNVFGSVTSAPATLSVIAPVPRRTVPMLNLTGDVGSLLHLECADTLAGGPSWQALDTLTLTSSPQLYIDLVSPVRSYRFYRAWQTNVASVRPAVAVGMATELTLSGAVGSKVEIDYINRYGPTDAWVALDTVTLTSTTQPYFDVSMWRQPARLYRLVPVP